MSRHHALIFSYKSLHVDEIDFVSKKIKISSLIKYAFLIRLLISIVFDLY